MFVSGGKKVKNAYLDNQAERFYPKVTIYYYRHEKNSAPQQHIPRPALGVSGGKGGWKPFQVSAADERFRMLSELNNFRNG